jgi:hypothetical protein
MRFLAPENVELQTKENLKTIWRQSFYNFNYIIFALFVEKNKKRNLFSKGRSKLGLVFLLFKI